MVLVWRTEPSDPAAWSQLCWECLRRIQRKINDTHRRGPASSLDYLHLDDAAALSHNHLTSIRSAEVRAGIEAQLMAANTMFRR